MTLKNILSRIESMSSASKNCKDCSAYSQSFFRNLGADSIYYLQSNKTQAEYKRGDTFSVENEPADSVFCVMNGSAKVTLYQKSIVRLVAAGDMLGYRCIFSQQKFRATASALGPVVACKISKESINHLIAKEPAFAGEMLKRMGDEIAASEHHHYSFCKKSVRERIAEAFCILVKKFGTETPQGIRIDTHLTRVELANWIGAAKETVIRELSDFKDEKLISEVELHFYVTNYHSVKLLAGLTN